MAGAMDKGLMALMGIDDDMGQDEGLLNHNTSSSFFDNASDSEHDDPEDDHDNTTPPTRSATPPADARTSTASKHGREQQQREHKPTQAPAPAPHRASTSSLFAASSAPKPKPSSASSSSSSPSSSSLFSPDRNPFSTGSPTKVRVNKSPKKTPRNAGTSSMFSPTLSPRKPKRSSGVTLYTMKQNFESPSATQSSQSQSSSTSMDLRVASLSPPLKPRAQRDPETGGLASPVSSLQLKKKTIAFSDSEDSDISPLEDNPTLSLSSVSRRNIALNASFTSDAEMDTDMPSISSRPSNTQSASKAAMAGLLEELSDIEQGQEHSQRRQQRQQRSANDRDREEDRDNDEHMLLSDAQAELVPVEPAKAKAPTKKQILEMQMEKERMWRNSDFAVQPRVNNKLTLSSLLQSAQTKLTHRDDKAPADTPDTLKTPPKSNRPVTIALDDDSEDETQEDVERRKDEARWKLDVSRALLVAPISKEQRLEISRDLQVRTSIPPGKRLEVERALQMTPLSNKIQNMSLSVGSPSSASHSASQTSPQKSSVFFNRRSSLKSPSKSQRPGTVPDIQQYNEIMKRELAKRNLERRKQLEMEAKKSGTWKSPEEYAAEQLRSEDKRTKGLDPDEDEDADDEHDEDYDASKDAGQPDVADDDEEAMDLNSGDEAQVLSGESEGEGEGENASKLDGQDLQSSDEDNDSMDSEEDDEDEGDNGGEDDEEEEEHAVKMRRTQKKTNVIGDEDEVKVVIVDRSQAPTAPDSDDETRESASESGSNNGNMNDSDDDVSDLEQDMNDDSGTQGFGAFFEASYDPSTAKKDTFTKLGRANAPALGMASTHSPVIASDPNQSPTLGDGQTGLSQSMAGALDFLSGNFPSATPQASSSSADDKLDTFSMPLTDQFGMDLPTMSPIIDEDDGFISSSLLGQVQSLDASMDPNSVFASQKPRNAFDVLAGAMRQNAVDGGDVNGGGLRRLQKRAAKPVRGGPISKNDKSAYIEYEAEEEEDEHMGMGGVDYESENDNDDYDLGDGMVDTNVVIDSKDAENVRQLHMKHEQVQHDKDISNLVQGIAAGGLWKRNKGQMDDLDLFDEEDMDGRFRRKKKLKVSEKIEKLADNPKTAAYARAFRKDKDDELLVFLSDPDESNDEADPSSKVKSSSRTRGDRDDEDMASLESEDEVQPVERVEESEDDEDEMLNTDKRKEKLRQARLLRDADGGSVNESMESGAITAMTKGQALPFGDSSSDDVVAERTVDDHSTKPAAPRAKKLAERREPVDEYEDILRRKKVIQDIIDGVEDPVEQDMGQASSQRRRTSSSFSAYRLMDRIVDRSQLPDPDSGAGSGSTSAFGGGRAGPEVDVEAIVRPRTLSRQNSSFMCEERKARFLSTVGEESRGANAGNRVVKEVNRRRMAFATSSRQDAASTASTSSSSTTTVRGVASQPSDPSATSKKGRTAAVSSGPSRLLRILTVDEE